MAHVKCKYTRFECRELKKTGEGCETICRECDYLESSQCFLETTRKNVEFDGEWLTIGKFTAYANWDFEDPIEGMNYIDELEIDGEKYVPEA